MLSSTQREGFPYLDEGSLPEEKTKILLAHIKRVFLLLVKRFYKKIIYLGYDNYSTIRTIIRENRVPKKYSINEKNYTDLSCNNIETLITSPLELEFFGQSLPSQHYLGLFSNKSNNEFLKIDPRLESLLLSKKKILYISFGSQHGNRFAKKIKKFMIKLNRCIGNLVDVQAVFSLGGATWEDFEIKNLTNVATFSFVPQTFLLSKCDVFITHGGMNSLKESLLEAVPMLCLSPNHRSNWKRK